MLHWFINKLEISHGTNTPLTAMEGLRGFAVFLVFWVHYCSLIEPHLLPNSLIISNFIHSAGNLGVDLFFVLSGYLIYGSIIDKTSFSVKKYSLRRIQRIYPTFLTVLFIYIVLSFIFPHESKLPSDFSQSALYILQNILLMPGIFAIDPIITVAWSLSYEAFYYIITPIIIFLFKIKTWSVKFRLLFWSLIVFLGAIVLEKFGGPSRLLMFIAGILLYELHSKKIISFSFAGTSILILSLVFFAFSQTLQLNSTLVLLLIFVAFLYVCLCAFNDQSRLSFWLNFKPLRWLGNMSYSYYLIHGLTLKFCFLIFNLLIDSAYQSEVIFYWLWLPFFIITFIISFILFIAVERPLSLDVKK